MAWRSAANEPLGESGVALAEGRDEAARSPARMAETNARSPADLTCLACRDDPQIRLGPSVPTSQRNGLLGPGYLAAIAEELDRSPMVEVAIDALGVDHVGDLCDHFTQGGTEVTGRLGARESLDPLHPGRESVVAPTSVAARRSEADMISFENDDGQRGVAPGQFVSSPQARVAGTDDGHIDIAVAREGSTDREVRTIPPEWLRHSAIEHRC